MTSPLETAFILLIVYQVKHYLCDFPLQTRYMLKKVLPTWGFLLPLLAHVAVHGAATLVIVLCFRPELWWLSLVDVAAHFAMDRIKASDRYLGRFRDRDKASYWNALGFDQSVHHLTHIFIIWTIVN